MPAIQDQLDFKELFQVALEWVANNQDAKLMSIRRLNSVFLNWLIAIHRWNGVISFISQAGVHGGTAPTGKNPHPNPLPTGEGDL